MALGDCGPSLEELFELLYDITPGGCHAEIVGGVVQMVPKRHSHWDVIRNVLFQLGNRFGPDSRLMVDVRLDLPGYGNMFCPDICKVSDGADSAGEGNWRYQDVEFVLEVISRATAGSDYGPKKAAYAAGGIPVYVIADPFTGLCHAHTMPKDGVYRSRMSVDFGDPIDLTDTVLGMMLMTDGFPRDGDGFHGG
ncbi:Uma2 family endonuclease [Streptomyces gamaensis]|uniref:Uma2 family endonuclease n=1 Tax=Streptomyces gamaensis TaxID=1763542 RepID=A0ABW0Z4U9_9ACTN